MLLKTQIDLVYSYSASTAKCNQKFFRSTHECPATALFCDTRAHGRCSFLPSEKNDKFGVEVFCTEYGVDDAVQAF